MCTRQELQGGGGLPKYRVRMRGMDKTLWAWFARLELEVVSGARVPLRSPREIMFLLVHLLIFASLANMCWLHFEVNPLASLRHERATTRFGI